VNMDKITIVTVTYNARDFIEATIQSVIYQTYQNIEYIIIDGGSDDGTLEIIKEYESVLAYWVSEPDAGIYDAMNKGAAVATGDWINFLNAGDLLYSNDVLAEVFLDRDLVGVDLVYGNNIYQRANETIQQIARPLKLFYKGMPFNHQSSFSRLSLTRKFQFDLTWKIQCEYEFLIKVYELGYKFLHVDVCMAIYADGGYSEQNNMERTLERWLIVKRLGIDHADIDQHYLKLLLGFSDFDGKTFVAQEVIAKANKKLNDKHREICFLKDKLASCDDELHAMSKREEEGANKQFFSRLLRRRGK